MERKYDQLVKTNLPKISFIGRLMLMCGLMLGLNVVGQAVTLWQNTDTTTVIANNSISCNLAGEHADNSYWRAFTPSVFGETGTFTVTAVRIGVEEATSGSGGDQPITVRIYTNSGGAFPAGTRTLIGTTNTTVANGALFFQDIAVSAPMQPVATEIVVEIFTPNGQTPNHRFFIGSNNLGQSAPSYISAADCGVPNPINVATAGAPNMHTLIGLVGNNIPTAAAVSVSGRVLSSKGTAIPQALVTMTDGSGEVRTARVNQFGYYSIKDVEAGQTYVFDVRAKGYSFVTQVRTIDDDLSGFDIMAQ